jgi:hypothetical protein
MKIDEKTIEQFKKIYKEEFNEELSDQEAFERFSRLVNVLRIVYFPELSHPIDKPDGYDIVRTQITR